MTKHFHLSLHALRDRSHRMPSSFPALETDFGRTENPKNSLKAEGTGWQKTSFTASIGAHALGMKAKKFPAGAVTSN